MIKFTGNKTHNLTWLFKIYSVYRESIFIFEPESWPGRCLTKDPIQTNNFTETIKYMWFMHTVVCCIHITSIKWFIKEWDPTDLMRKFYYHCACTITFLKKQFLLKESVKLFLALSRDDK